MSIKKETAEKIMVDFYHQTIQYNKTICCRFCYNTGCKLRVTLILLQKIFPKFDPSLNEYVKVHRSIAIFDYYRNNMLIANAIANSDIKPSTYYFENEGGSNVNYVYRIITASIMEILSTYPADYILEKMEPDFKLHGIEYF